MILTEATNRAVQLHGNRLRALPNVNGVWEGYKVRRGIQTKEPAVIVSVEKKKPIEPSMLKRIVFRRLHPANAVPSRIEGVQTDVLEVGEFVAFKENCAKQKVIGPGCGISHPDVTCGTFGFVATDVATGEEVGITNNHVAAASNAGRKGDPILHPCTYCGGTDADAWGALWNFVPVEFESNPCSLLSGVVKLINAVLKLFGRHSEITIKEAPAENLVDAAAVLPYDGVEMTADVPEMGTPSPGIIEPYVGLPVEKVGWRTWHSEGQVIGINATVRVSYGEAGIAVFTDQIVFALPSDGGDSGSGIRTRYDSEIRPASLLFAGSNETNTTIGARPANVEALLGVRDIR